MTFMDKKIKTAFVCTNCGAMYPRWQGQCSQCQEWNSLTEERIITRKSTAVKRDEARPIRLADIDDNRMLGIKSGITELDRVLGGGMLPGSSILLAGEPGIGKSTLVLQAAGAYSKAGCRVLYITGEESLNQIKKRSMRVKIRAENIGFANTTDLEEIMSLIDSDGANVVIVDSIQTISSAGFQSPPGTVGQIRESAGRLIEKAHKDNFALFLIGHVTKEGLVAGPKVLEHMVDVVLSCEGDSRHLYRLLRPIKNRYGSTLELGVFEMSSSGLTEVPNPSSLFLSDLSGERHSGSVIAASCEGNRPILVEIQALVSAASYGMPQRVAGGIDNKRLALLLAILEKRLGIPMGQNDVFVSVAGGLKLNDPAIDLAVMASIISSLRDIAVDSHLVLCGEVGLSGEVRTIGLADRRAAEVSKLGFKKMILPAQNMENVEAKRLKIHGVKTLEEALEILF